MNIFNSSVHKISENLKGQQSIALHVLDEKVLFFCFCFMMKMIQLNSV